MVMKPGDIEVGSRIESDGQHGTVKYIGEVPPTKGLDNCDLFNHPIVF